MSDKNPSKTPVTIKDIAADLGVHYSSVSLALRDSPKVSEARRKEIKARAEAMGYVRNPIYSALGEARRRKVTHAGKVSLAFVSDRNSHHHDRVEAHIRTAAAEYGYLVETFVFGEHGLPPSRLESILFNRGVQGVILGTFNRARMPLEMNFNRFTVVAVGYSQEVPGVHRVRFDYFRETVDALEKITRRGYRRIGFVHSEDCLKPNNNQINIMEG